MRGRLPSFYLLALALVALGACQIPPDVRAMPRYVRDLFTNPNFVVNAPLAHELFGTARGTPSPADRAARFRLPPGFAIEVFARGLPHPRYMRVTARGDVIVSQPRKQKVWLLRRDEDGDGLSDEARVLLSGLRLPHGVELVGDRLFVAGPAYIVSVRFDVDRGITLGEPALFAALPDTGGHAWRPLRLGPDEKLYTAIGAACNVCEPDSPREQAILRFDLVTGEEEIVATGFRNAAHFDWHPETGSMFATEVGVDYLGENLPPEELNEIETGAFYGFPYLHGPAERDAVFSPPDEAALAASRPPAHVFTAHSTPLGVSFLRDPSLPDAYRGAALVALKGSWNRTRKSGYKIVSLHWSWDESGARTIAQRDFLTGFELDEDVVGRPVDVVEGVDGSIFVSDDMAGAIYRIRRTGDLNENAFALDVECTEPVVSAPDSVASLAPGERERLREEGARLYARHDCATCHSSAEGRPAAVPLARIAARDSLGEVRDRLRRPPASMPRLLLTPAERQALAVYVLESRD